MDTLQKEIIATLGVKPTINPEEEIRTRVDFLKGFIRSNPSIKGFVLGISGGQDSSLSGKLAQTAVEELRAEGHEATFIAMRLPYGEQRDEADAQAALSFINPDKVLTFNIKATVDALKVTYDALGEGELSDYHKGNVKARARAVAQYAVAGANKMLVIGTDHAAEALAGFFTKYGDGAADVLPISGLTKGQGKELLKTLKAPELLYTKAPTADLLDNVVGQPDETELGITYEVMDAYLRGETIPDDQRMLIEGRYLMTEHKRHLPIAPMDDWMK